MDFGHPIGVFSRSVALTRPAYEWLMIPNQGGVYGRSWTSYFPGQIRCGLSSYGNYCVEIKTDGTIESLVSSLMFINVAFYPRIYSQPVGLESKGVAFNNPGECGMGYSGGATIAPVFTQIELRNGSSPSDFTVTLTISQAPGTSCL